MSVNMIKSQDGMRARTLGKIQCYSCKKFGHKSNECRSKKNKVSKDRADGHEKADRKSADKKLIKCYNCNGNGHYKKDCPSRKKEVNIVEANTLSVGSKSCKLLKLEIDVSEKNKKVWHSVWH